MEKLKIFLTIDGRSTPNSKMKNPVKSLQIEIGYPDFDDPIGENGKPNIIYHNKAMRFILGQESSAERALAIWKNDDNTKYHFVFSLPRLDPLVQGWDINEVLIRKTIIFDKSIPEVEYPEVLVTEEKRKGSFFTIVADVGHVIVRFRTRPIPPGITMELLCTIGSRNDSIQINKDNWKNIIWEIFSDKYIDEKFFTYEVKVTAVSPNSIDVPIEWRSPAPIKVDVPGRFKQIEELISIPDEPQELTNKINEYLKAFEING